MSPAKIPAVETPTETPTPENPSHPVSHPLFSPVQVWHRRERGAEMKPFANSWNCWRSIGLKFNKSFSKKLIW